MIHEENLVCQKLRLYGLRPSQFLDLKLRKEVLLGFKKSDYSRIESMRQKILATFLRNGQSLPQNTYESVSDTHENVDLLDILNELDTFEKLKVKAEIESLESCINGSLRGTYLIDCYLQRLEMLIQGLLPTQSQEKSEKKNLDREISQGYFTQ